MSHLSQIQSSPQTTFDEVKHFANQNGALCRVRIRVLEIGPTTVVVFSENRIPDLHPVAEVINPGTSITNMAEELAHLCEVEWGLIPVGRDVRFFEHYSGIRPGLSSDLNEATVAEILFQNITDEDFSQRSRTKMTWLETEAERLYVVQVLGRGNWRQPTWKHIDLQEAETLLGVELHFRPQSH
jgi:hypothetical protein